MTVLDPATLTDLLPQRPELSAARMRLYSTALVLFGERGYHGVSVRDITDALGQKPGAIYAHVQSKQELLFELARIGVAEHGERIRSAHDAAGADPVEQIRAIVRSHVAVHLEFPALARVVNQEARLLETGQVETLMAVTSGSELLMLDSIERGAALGLFHVDDPFLVVTAIAAMGVRAVEWWTPDSARSARQVADTYADYAVKLLR